MRARVLEVLTAEENRKWWTLSAVAFGLFMIMLDNTVVNVALPSIQRDLHVKLSELEWIVTGYALTFAALLITGGKLGDLFGRRRIFVIGIAIFTISSLACGLAPTAGFLIGARAVQGIGAALMNPASLSIIVTAEGMVRDPQVTRSLDKDLDKNALECVKKWKFEPATKDGKPVATHVAVEVSFNVQ